MRELAFLVTGFSEDDGRKLRRRRPSRAPARVVGWALLGAALLYLLFGAKPAVEITSPASGTTTFEAQILVAGRATGIQGDAVTLEVNGASQSVPISDGSFEAQVSLVLGDNAIRASANGISSKPIPIIRKPQPVIKFNSPIENLRTTRAEIDVIGTVENSDDRTVTLDVNGTAHEVPVTNSQFSTTATLVVGRNVIRALVTGASPATIEVFRLETGIAITSPPNGYTTDRETVTVSGTVANAETDAITLKSNELSRTVPVRNGSFTSEIALNVGDNRIKASLDAASFDEIVVHRRLPPVIITLTSPQSGSTQSAVASVRGTVQNARSRTITLRVNASSRAVLMTGSTFAAEVRLEIGDNVIQASQDHAVSKEVVVNRQLPSTLIGITSPGSGPTNASSVRVRGRVANPRGDTITLTVNGLSRSVPITNGAFAYDVKLGYGDTRIQASQGDAVSIEVVVTRAEPPRTLIRITSPGNGPTKASSVRVTGTITNPRGDTITLTVNGSARKVQVTDGGFSYDVKLGYGDTHIQASQGDAVSNEVILTLIQAQTLIRIISPRTGPTKESFVKVTGTITNPRGDTITLTVNGSARKVQVTDGSFFYDVKLGYGDTRIQASQGDAVSNEVILTLIQAQTLIRIISPRTGPTKDSFVTVKGTITNPHGDTITLTVNGSARKVQVTDGGFSYDVKLGYGDTRIQASQGDAVSNEVILTLIQAQTLIRIISPRTGPTKESFVKVTGTITNPRGDTITLTVNGSARKVQVTDGGFFYDVKLGYGDTHIQASQGDAVSNEVILTLIQAQTLIRIISPRTGPTKESFVKVTGTITNPHGDTITLTVNGSARKVQVTDGGFSYDVKLGYGDTRIQASQGDVVSNEVIVSRGAQTDGGNPPDVSECSKINCDCKNLKASRIPTDSWSRAFGASVTAQPLSFPASAGAPPQDRHAQCSAVEEKLRQTCKETGRVSGVCPPEASGPNAWPKKKPRSSISKKQGGNKQ